MRLFVILGEDHHTPDFQPLSWSLPVYEVRCGIFSLRERLQQVLVHCVDQEPGVTICDLGLLLRRSLLALGRPERSVLGPEACRRELRGGDRILWLSARLGPRWEILAGLIGTALKGEDLAWFQGCDLVASSTGVEMAVDLLAAWEAWQEEAHCAGCWRRAEVAAPPWHPSAPFTGWQEIAAEGENRILAPADAAAPSRRRYAPWLEPSSPEAPTLLSHLWDLVPATGAAIVADVQKVVAVGGAITRDLFGIEIQADAWPDGVPWRARNSFVPATHWPGVRDNGVHLLSSQDVWLADDVRLEPTAVLDAGAGPIVLDRGVRVMPHAYLAGPLYVGAGTLIKAGARIYGDTSLGAICKVAGEVGESTFADFVNKQHEGFIGHAVLGSWVNLGADTTCSDLKNNYGPVRVDLGRGAIDSGLRSVGLLMGEHSKSAIGTHFNTGTCVGLACNVFADGFPPKYLPNFTWGDSAECIHDPSRALATARWVMARRGVVLGPGHEALFRDLARQ